MVRTTPPSLRRFLFWGARPSKSGGQFWFGGVPARLYAGYLPSPTLPPAGRHKRKDACKGEEWDHFSNFFISKKSTFTFTFQNLIFYPICKAF